MVTYFSVLGSASWQVSRQTSKMKDRSKWSMSLHLELTKKDSKFQIFMQESLNIFLLLRDYLHSCTKAVHIIPTLFYDIFYSMSGKFALKKQDNFIIISNH